MTTEMSTEPTAGLDKRRIAASFNRAAGTYEQHDFVQREVAARALERLDYIALVPQHALDVGSGTGRCARALASRYPRARILQCDLAPAMLALARSRERRFFSRQTFVAADIEQLPFSPAAFQLAFSSLALQWCQQLASAFAEIRRVLAPGGLFLFTTLGPDTLGELRRAWANASAAPHVNNFFDMHDVGDALMAAGFADPVMETEYLTVDYENVMTLMRDLKGIGASNSALERTRGLHGRRALSAVTAAYEHERRNGKLPATYEVIYGHAWAEEGQRRRPSDVRTFPLERLRRK